MISPQDALQKHFVEHGRAQFHPRVPLSLESILALLVLTVYEYVQRGNMTKMRARAGQALVMALDMGLCDKEDGRERYAETRRRAWWMTVCLFLVFLNNGELIFCSMLVYVMVPLSKMLSVSNPYFFVRH
jgi:hypothetical protein